jgi:hypothetical protein
MGEIKHNLLGQVRLEGNFEDYLQEEYQARVLLLLLLLLLLLIYYYIVL